MSGTPKIRRSLSKTLTLKLALLMTGILLILGIGSYTILSRSVHTEQLEYNLSIASVVMDDLCVYAEAKGTDGEGYYREAEVLGEYFCSNGYSDYLYAYFVQEDLRHILIVGASESAGTGFVEQLPPEPCGKVLEYEPDPQELDLWQGRIRYLEMDDHLVSNAREGVVAATDAQGNRIVVASGVSFALIDSKLRSEFRPILVALIVSFILLTVFTYFILRKSVLVPAGKVSVSMATFIRDGRHSREKLDESGDDEFAMIAASFNRMTDEIDDYLENIRKLTGEQERQRSELDIASRIQQGMLAPGIFRSEACDIRAVMMPARNVGGDLYDYVKMEDGRILISVADVSGKGIAASLYMIRALNSIRLLAASQTGPAEILEKTNRIITANNGNMLFITAFVGIYDPKDGSFVYANAGHNPPYVLRSRPEQITGARNLVLGLYGDEPYVEDRLRLSPGDIVFLYTDGVTEAVNGKKEFFGETGLSEALDAFRPSHEVNAVEFVQKKLKEFTGAAEQYDDTTMLAFTAKESAALELMPESREFGKIRKIILDSALPGPLQRSLCVAAEEIFINICSYAFEGREKETGNRIWFTFEHSDRVLLKFEDNGIPYDPTAAVDYDIDYDPDEKLGGLGKIIAFTIADEVCYEYTENKNVLTMSKYLMEEER